MEILAIFIGLAVTIVVGGRYITQIRDNDLIPPTCVGVGLIAFGIVSLILTPAYGVIAGIAATLVALLLSLENFGEQGEVQIFQPGLFRANTALDPREWALMFPGYRLIWTSVAKLVAKIQSGKIVVTGDSGGDISVQFKSGVGSVKFRLDAETPISLDRNDTNYAKLMVRFVRSVPTGEGLDNSKARANNVRDFCIARIKRLIETVSETISVFEVDAGQLQAAIVAAPAGGGKSPLELAFQDIEDKVGLPAASISLEIEDAEPGEEAKKVIALNAITDTIRNKAIVLLEASGVGPVDSFALELAAAQRADAATYRPMSDAERNDVSKVDRVVRLRKAFGSMMSPDAFKTMADSDTKTRAMEKARAINEYNASHNAAEADLEIAERAEREFRKEAIACDDANTAAKAALPPGGALDPKRVSLSKRARGTLETYRAMYGKVLQEAVDKTAAGADTSRVSIAGLENLNGARGLDALHILAGKTGK
jgi:hypothetical protein